MSNIKLRESIKEVVFIVVVVFASVVLHEPLGNLFAGGRDVFQVDGHTVYIPPY